jgi:hypothetical protein
MNRKSSKQNRRAFPGNRSEANDQPSTLLSKRPARPEHTDRTIVFALKAEDPFYRTSETPMQSPLSHFGALRGFVQSLPITGKQAKSVPLILATLATGQVLFATIARPFGNRRRTHA